VSQLLDRADERLVDLAWSLWTALGVSSWASPADAAVIEVEPLLAYTAIVGKDDQRLLREVTSWVVEQMPLLSLRQFKSVVRAQRWPFEGPIEAFGATLAHATGKTWPGKRTGPTAVPRGDRPATADLTKSCALQLRLRALVGVSSRAEVIRVLLLADRPLTVSELSDRVAYTRRQVSGDIDLLLRASFVTRTSSSGTATVELARRAIVREVVGQLGRDVDWAPALRVLTGLRELLDDLDAHHWAEPSVEIARQLRSLEPQFERIRHDITPPAHTPEAVTDAIVELTRNLSAEIPES